jgi:hypothetical protein
MPAVMHNYVTKLALPIPELDDGAPHPILRTVWLPMVMHDPAIFQVIVLFAAAHYATYAEPERWHTFYAEILSLKQNALKALLGGLKMANMPRDPSGAKALSNGDEECLIAAIAKMASYEAIYGDAAAVCLPPPFLLTIAFPHCTLPTHFAPRPTTPVHSFHSNPPSH